MYKIEQIPIKKIGKVVTGKTPSTTDIKNFGGEYMFVTPVELHADFIINESQKTLSRKGLDSIKANSIHGLSIAVGCIGWDMGNVAIIESECATNQQINSITDIKPEYNPYYLYYWLLTKKQYLFQIATVTRTPILNKTTFEDILVPMPEKSIQDKIVSLLLPISKKIALNNAINAELEKMARTLYDYWFVQFDFPNAEGKPYRVSGGEMVYSEQLKHEIPKGWKVEKLNQNDICSIIGSGIENFDGEKIYLSTSEVDSLDIVNHTVFIDYNNRPDRANMQPRLNSVWFAKMKDTGKNILVNDGAEILTTNYIFSTGFSGLQCLETTLYYVWNYLRGGYFDKKKNLVATGATQQAINDNDLSCFDIVVSPEPVLERFHIIVSPYYNRISRMKFENKELATLRDFLLPLLMNGQITVLSNTIAMPENTGNGTDNTTSGMDAQAKKTAVFKRLVLSAYILDNICDEPTAGRVKFEKLLYLSEHCAQLPLYSEFHRAAAGPYDSKALYAIEDKLKKENWFKRQKIKDESRAYIRMAQADGYKSYIDSNLDARQKSVIDNLVRLFKSLRTIQCEIVATLYGAWNDFLIDGVQPTDDQIVDEVLTNWHESKERIDRQRWLKALGWMRQNGVVPTGYGVSTKNS